ncbi:MAG: DJ-1/PfpI family protein [Candidatus Devosia symbiotica]|nr:DJ-1/PfpI family protein [Candidatus Devosia symbiotica]
MPNFIYRTSIAILIVSGIEELNFIGPWEMFTTARLLSAPLDMFSIGWRDAAVTYANGLKVTTDYAFADKPHADVVLIPSGQGIHVLAQDDEFNAELRLYLSDAIWETSVCIGAALLGAPSSLKTARPPLIVVLSISCASTPHTYILNQRYVYDRNLVTSAGVSAGIDMSLWLVGHLFGDDTARSTQTHMEYFPEPPYGNAA